MKFLGISAVVCCLLAEVVVGQHLLIKHRSGYSVSTNKTQIVVLWNNQPIVQGIASNMRVAVSPDGKAVAWVQEEYYDHPEFLDEADQHRTAYGILCSAHNGSKPVQVQAPQTSRGENFQWDRRSPFTTWYPGDLCWDSTSRYLYFSTPLCPTRGALWQLQPGDSNPRFIESGGDWWLVKQWHCADNIVIQGLRYEATNDEGIVGIKDYKKCYLYTHEDIAKPQFVPSEKRVKPPVKG